MHSPTGTWPKWRSRFNRVVAVLTIAALMSGSVSQAGGDLDDVAEALRWLQGESHRLIRASRRVIADGTAAFPPQVGLGYEAFWLRDYAYTLEGSADSYSDKELLDAAALFIRSMRADGAGVDCVKFDGTPIYKPGFGTMGTHPVADGSQFTVAVAWHTYRKTRDGAFLRRNIDALVKTMQAVPRNPETKLVHIREGEPWDRCPYGFTDTVQMTGDVLFCSLLYVEASKRLGDLLDAAERPDEAARWRAEADAVAHSVRRVFWDPQAGLFRAATGRCREHHIWGSAFAVYLGVADETQASAVATYFRQHYDGIVQHGQIRHLPPGVYWESCRAGRDTYQNGAYWATPAGWFVYTLDLVDPRLADQTILDLVADFRTAGACEWVFREKRILPNYLASAALPIPAIQATLHRRNQTSQATAKPPRSPGTRRNQTPDKPG